MVDNITSEFIATGICPRNSNVFTDKDVAPAQAPSRPEHVLDEDTMNIQAFNLQDAHLFDIQDVHIFNPEEPIASPSSAAAYTGVVVSNINASIAVALCMTSKFASTSIANIAALDVLI